MSLQKSKFLFELALLLLFVIYVPSSSASAQERWNAVVVKITDGDTVWVSVNSRRVKLRLLGIDTPEKYKGRKLRRDAARCGISQAAMVRLGIEATREAKITEMGTGQLCNADPILGPVSLLTRTMCRSK